MEYTEHRQYQGSYVFNMENFEGRLKCNLCAHVFENDNNRKCKAKVCIGVPYCWQHLRIRHHLRIKESEFGKGLFAEHPKRNHDHEICFKQNDIICPYIGESLKTAQIKERYGEDTAPYAVNHGNYYIDAALRRGMGSLANHANHPNFNAAYIYRTQRDFNTSTWTEREDLGRPLSNYPIRNDRKTHRPVPGLIYVYATKDIKYGEQILANYGDAYQFNHHSTRVRAR